MINGYKSVNLGHETTFDTLFIDNESKLFCQTVDHADTEITTLAELRSMSVEQLKEM